MAAISKKVNAPQFVRVMRQNQRDRRDLNGRPKTPSITVLANRKIRGHNRGGFRTFHLDANEASAGTELLLGIQRSGSRCGFGVCFFA
jgi:hypothetical protein